ncbi:MAG TPA: hypothetical protein VMQ11_04800 [Alphaproteobacteria bacterium]|nr:hypothetical protein [Alphaproteobacteria bacterium]
MRHFLIACELYQGDEFDYQPFYEQLAALGAKREEKVWVLDIDMTLAQVLDALKVHVHPDTDKVVVLQCSPKPGSAVAREAGIQRPKSRALAWLGIPSVLERLRRAGKHS